MNFRDKYLFIGLFIVLLGSITMFIYDFSFDSNLTKGNVLAILCSICFAFVVILSDNIRQKDSALTFSRLIFFYAASILGLIAFFKEIILFEITLTQFQFLLFLGIVPTIIGHSVFYYLVKYLSPTVVASIPFYVYLVYTSQFFC